MEFDERQRQKLDALLSKFVHFETQIAQIPALTAWMSGMDSHITKTLGDFATRLAEMEQNISTLTARLCKVETYAASASNVSGSARSWPSLEQVDGNTAAGSHGPGSPNDNRNTRRRLDVPSRSEDEHARSAVLFTVPMRTVPQRNYEVVRSGSIICADSEPLTVHSL